MITSIGSAPQWFQIWSLMDIIDNENNVFLAPWINGHAQWKQWMSMAPISVFTITGLRGLPPISFLRDISSQIA